MDCLTRRRDDCDKAQHTDFPRLGGLIVTQFVSNVITQDSAPSRESFLKNRDLLGMLRCGDMTDTFVIRGDLFVRHVRY